MEQPQVMVSTDIGEVRMETRAAVCQALSGLCPRPTAPGSGWPSQWPRRPLHWAKALTFLANPPIPRFRCYSSAGSVTVMSPVVRFCSSTSPAVLLRTSMIFWLVVAVLDAVAVLVL